MAAGDRIYVDDPYIGAVSYWPVAGVVTIIPSETGSSSNTLQFLAPEEDNPYQGTRGGVDSGDALWAAHLTNRYWIRVNEDYEYFAELIVCTNASFTGSHATIGITSGGQWHTPDSRVGTTGCVTTIYPRAINRYTTGNPAAAVLKGARFIGGGSTGGSSYRTANDVNTGLGYLKITCIKRAE